MLLKSDELSLREKIELIKEPDLYVAENIRDYLDSIKSLKFPWYKRFPAIDLIYGGEWISYVDIRIYNVGIEFVKNIPEQNMYKFVLHDATASMAVLWQYKGERYFGPGQSFEECQQEEKLENKDWAYEVVFAHVKGHVRFIDYVRKGKPRIKKEITEKEPLIEKIRRLLPSPEPIPAPAPNY